MPTIASLIVTIGAKDQEIQKALASIGEKAKSVDADLKKLGNTDLAGKAQKSLDALRATMKQVTDEQARVAERARLAAAGIEQMGGAGALSSSQLKQMNRTLQEGISSYRALGKEAPAELQKVADAVKGKLEEPMGFIEKKAMALGVAIGTFLGNAAIQVGRAMLDSAKASFAYADSLENLSEATDVTVGGLQRIENLGVTSGVSMETLANSVGMLQKNLDSPGGKKALADMRLNYEAIRKLKPEDQWFEIGQAIADTEDPIERMNRGTALFGRQWMTIAPAMQGNLRELANSIRTLSDEQVEALDVAGDAWDKWKKRTDRNIASFLGNLVLAAQKGKVAYQDLLSPQLALQKLVRGGDANAADFEGNLPKIEAPRLDLPSPFSPEIKQGGDELIEILEKSDKALQPLIEAGEKFKAVQDQLFGRAIIANAEMLVKALGDTENVTKLTEASTKNLHQELGKAIEAYEALGRDVPPKLQEIYDKTRQIKPIEVKATAGPSLQGLTKTFVAFGEAAADGTLYAHDFSYELNAAQIKTDYFGRSIDVDLIPSVKRAGVEFQEAEEKTVGFGQALKSIFQGKGFGDLGKALKGGLGDVKEGIFEGFGNLIAGGLTSVINKGLGLLGSGIKKLFGNLFGTSGRDAVRDFAALEGGFDKLHQKLGTLGTEGEQLWITLTQGVGRNNADQAKAAIDKVTKALAEQKQKFDELQTSVDTATEKLGELTLITPEIEAALDKVFNQSTVEGHLAAVTDLNAELDKQAKKYSDIEAALNKYGIGFENAGKEFQQAKLNEKAISLRKDFDSLRNAGVDINVQMRAMGGNIRDFIAEAQKGGLEVPESFRQIIQTAIDAGEVFDADGKKITDISQLGLKFGTTMETAMKTVATAVSRLTTVLEGLAKFLGIELPKAAEEGVDGINDELKKIVIPDFDPKIDIGRVPDFSQPDVPQFKTGSEGVQDFGSGTLAMLHGREAVITESDLRRNATASFQGAAPITINNEFHIDGVFSEGDLVQTIQRRFIPIFNRSIEDNVNSARTNLQDVLLGVT